LLTTSIFTFTFSESLFLGQRRLHCALQQRRHRRLSLSESLSWIGATAEAAARYRRALGDVSTLADPSVLEPLKEYYVEEGP
jgi:hypothetical protein